MNILQVDFTVMVIYINACFREIGQESTSDV